MRLTSLSCFKISAKFFGLICSWIFRLGARNITFELVLYYLDECLDHVTRYLRCSFSQGFRSRSGVSPSSKVFISPNGISNTSKCLEKVAMQCRSTLRDTLGDLWVISNRLNLSLSSSLSGRDRCEPAPIKMQWHVLFTVFYSGEAGF
jgi:hypothetical protein